jgi:hypothetical protein
MGKPPDVKNISPFIQLLEPIAKQEYEITALVDNQLKIQHKTSESYKTIIKALAEKRAEFHTYKLKEERSCRLMLKNMHYSINPQEIKTEIEKLGHTVTNIWNIKKYGTKLSLSMFFVELKPAGNNKVIFNVEYIQQCKIKFEQPKHKRDTAQCARSQRYGNTKKYCDLKSRFVKCSDDHLTNQCHQKEVSSDARCVLCGGNHPANYKGCTVYKGLQNKTYTPPHLKQYIPAQIKQTLHTHPGITYARITNQNSYAATNIEQDPHINQPHQQTTDVQDLKHMMKPFLNKWELC